MPSSNPAAAPHTNRTIIEGMRLVSDLEQSGLSQAEFARQRGESDKSVSYWVRRVRVLRQAAKTAAPPPSAALVHVADISSSGAVVPVAVGGPGQVVVPTTAGPGTDRVPRMAPGVGIEVRCGGRSLVVGPGFDRVLLGELIRCLEGLPPC